MMPSASRSSKSGFYAWDNPDSCRCAFRIFFVDDNAEAAGHVVESMSNTVRVSCDGASAIQDALEVKPHVVLIYTGLPK